MSILYFKKDKNKVYVPNGSIENPGAALLKGIAKDVRGVLQASTFATPPLQAGPEANIRCSGDFGLRRREAFVVAGYGFRSRGSAYG